MNSPGRGAAAAVNGFVRAFLDLFFPPLCHVCRSFVPDTRQLHICDSCLEKMPLPGHPRCIVCGVPFLGAGDDHTCGSCLSAPPRYDLALAAALHEGPVRTLVHDYKYLGKVHLRRPLALLIAERLVEAVSRRGADLIVPVPLHVRRLRSRGFNQSLLLAEMVSRRWQLPLERRLLRRVRWTEPQINLAPRERRENVRGAFAVADDERVSGKRIVLVDDVLTTGSTVDECAGALKRAGAAEVMVVTVARVPAPWC